MYKKIHLLLIDIFWILHTHKDRVGFIRSGMDHLFQLAAWQRNGDLTSLADLPALRRTLPAVDCELEDPVTFRSFDDYFRVLDVISADVAALAELLPVEV